MKIIIIGDIGRSLDLAGLIEKAGIKEAPEIVIARSEEDARKYLDFQSKIKRLSDEAGENVIMAASDPSVEIVELMQKIVESEPYRELRAEPLFFPKKKKKKKNKRDKFRPPKGQVKMKNYRTK